MRGNPMTAPNVPFYQRRLQRSADDRWLGGVLGGVAQTYNWNSALVRLLFIISFLLPGPQILIYLVAWFIMPAPRY